MNILNILGLVSTGQRNVAAGQESSTPAAPLQQQSLFLPMLLQLFAGSAMKIAKSAILQEPVNNTAQLSIDSRQLAKPADSDLELKFTKNPGLRIFDNGIAFRGAAFAMLQSNQYGALKILPVDNEAGLKNDGCSEPVVMTSPLVREAAFLSPMPPVEDGVLSIAKDVAESSEQASLAVQSNASNPKTSIGLPSLNVESVADSPQPVIGPMPSNGSVELTGFEFTRNETSSTISETVQNVSPGVVNAQPATPPLHADEAGKTLSPGSTTNMKQNADFSQADQSQPLVQSVESNGRQIQYKSFGNRAMVAESSVSAPSPASSFSTPQLMLDDMESILVTSKNLSGTAPSNPIQQAGLNTIAADVKTFTNEDGKSNGAASKVNSGYEESIPPSEPEVSFKTALASSPVSSSSKLTSMFADSESTDRISQGVTYSSREMAAESFASISTSKPVLTLRDAKSTDGQLQYGITGDRDLVAATFSTLPPPSSRPTVQSVDVESSLVLPQSQSSSNHFAFAESSSPISPSSKPAPTLNDTESMFLADNNLSWTALPNPISQPGANIAVADVRSPKVNSSNAESILPLAPEVSFKTASRDTVVAPKSVDMQTTEVSPSIPESLSSPKTSSAGDRDVSQVQNLSAKDIAAVAAQKALSFTPSLVSSPLKPAPMLGDAKPTGKVLQTIAEQTTNIRPMLPVEDEVFSVVKDVIESPEQASSAVQSDASNPETSMDLHSLSVERVADSPQPMISETHAQPSRPQLHIDEPVNTLSPGSKTDMKQNADFSLIDQSQPLVRSVDTNSGQTQNKSFGNRVMVGESSVFDSSPASSFSTPRSELGVGEAIIGQLQSEGASNRAAVVNSPYSVLTSSKPAGSVESNVVLPQKESSSNPAESSSTASSLFPLSKVTIKTGDVESSVVLPQTESLANPEVVAVSLSTASSPLSEPIPALGNPELSLVLPQKENSNNPLVAAEPLATSSSLASPSLKPTIQSGDVESILVPDNDLLGPATLKPKQQDGVSKSVADEKTTTSEAGKSKGESSKVNLSHEESILPFEDEVSFKTAFKETVLAPKSVDMHRPEVSSSVPVSSPSPKALSAGDRDVAQVQNFSRKDIAPVPANHPDAKGRIEKGQETDVQGTTKGAAPVLRVVVKTESETAAGKNSDTNEQFHPQEKIADTTITGTDSDAVQSAVVDPAAKNEAALAATPAIDNKTLSGPAAQTELLARMTSQFSSLHNQQLTPLRQANSVQSSAASLPNQSGLTTGNLEQTIMDQVSKNLALNLHNNSSEVRIAMKPESLGEVVMKVKMDDGKVSAQINVNNVNVKAVLDANVAQLHDTLLSRGIEVQRIDIVADGQAAFGSSSGQNKPKQKSQQRDTPDVTALGQYESLRTMGYNTIELIM
jgi:Flagellar hook-length control protein FliK